MERKRTPRADAFILRHRWAAAGAMALVAGGVFSLAAGWVWGALIAVMYGISFGVSISRRTRP